MRGFLILGLIALAILLILCPSCRAPAIEADINAKAVSCATDFGVPADFVKVSGRDVTLEGFVPSQTVGSDLASCIAAKRGVRTVDNRLQQLAAGSLHIHTTYGAISMSGVVPSKAARDAVVAEAQSLWGTEAISEDLQVDPGKTLGAWSADSFASTLAALHHSRRDLEIELTGGHAVVSGTVLSNLARTRVLGAAKATLPEFEIVDRLTVRDPADPRETLQADLDRLLGGEIVEFATDSAELTSRGRAVLDEVVAILKRHPGRVEISGHTDSTGMPDHNDELSRQRAASAAQYLAATGIDAARLATVGHGANRPIATNTTVEGRQANRRTEFHSLKEN